MMNQVTDDNKENSIEEALSSADIIYTSEQITAALDNLAIDINTRLEGANPLVLCVMKGVAPPKTSIQQIYGAALPFIILDLIAIVLLIVFPVLATWLPSVMLR